jgi:glycosyltransferase involved in cell wall biosynthesis
MDRLVEPAGRVLHLGPALSVRGGVSAVERLIVEHVGAVTPIEHIATMEDGSLWRKLVVYARALVELVKVLRSGVPVVVHIHFASRGSTLRKAILAWIVARARRPLVLHAHGASFDQFFTRLPRFLQRRLKRLFARADCFIVLSTQWRDFYVRHCGVPGHRVRVLHNPTALPHSVPDRAGRKRVQFLFLGRIGSRKGAFDLLRAFAALPPELRARARLVYAGDGDVERLRREASGLADSVEVRAWIGAAERDSLLDESDVFVLPSYSEGVPMALLEALAHGLPVITTQVGGIADIVADRCEGLIVTPGNVEQLEAALRLMIEDEARRLELGRHARLRAESFDVSRYRVELLRLYEGLLAQACVRSIR